MHDIRTAVTVAAVTAIVAAGCGSSGGSTTSPSSTGSNASTSSSSAAPASSSGSGTLTVDLTISGDASATLRGTKGRCTLSKAMGSSYSFTGADFPALGPNGVFGLTIGTRLGDRVQPPLIKLVVGDSGFISGADVSGIQSNPEGTVVDLNQQISGATSGGPTKTVLIHGTLHCG